MSPTVVSDHCDNPQLILHFEKLQLCQMDLVRSNSDDEVRHVLSESSKTVPFIIFMFVKKNNGSREKIRTRKVSTK